MYIQILVQKGLTISSGYCSLTAVSSYRHFFCVIVLFFSLFVQPVGCEPKKKKKYPHLCLDVEVW